jgi:DNA modification methylase
MGKNQDWPAFAVERRAVAALVPYARNARTHSPEQVAAIAASIREWGFTAPVLIDEAGGIIAGHARVLAARSLGARDVPVVVARGWSEAQKRAYVLADNQLALNAGWDEELLRIEIGGLGEDGFDLGLLGFGIDFLADLLADRTAGLTDPDEAPPLGVNAVSRRGDLWICGNHRLLCGDATAADDVARLLGGVKPNLMVTDPPYGVEYDAEWRNHSFRVDGLPSDGRAIGKVPNDGRLDWREAYALFPGQIAYVWHASWFTAATQTALEGADFKIRAEIIWAKTRFVISRGDYHWQHEPCWYAVRKKGQWTGDRSQSTLWTIDHQVSETGHSTQKPVECMRRPIVNNSSAGQAVYDPFVGSGTTIIAAEMEGRAALCLEIDERYCDVAIKRWQAFTGEAATLDGDGRTFEDISEERYDPAKDAAASYDAAIKAKRERAEAAE